MQCTDLPGGRAATYDECLAFVQAYEANNNNGDGVYLFPHDHSNFDPDGLWNAGFLSYMKGCFVSAVNTNNQILAYYNGNPNAEETDSAVRYRVCYSDVGIECSPPSPPVTPPPAAPPPCAPHGYEVTVSSPNTDAGLCLSLIHI